MHILLYFFLPQTQKKTRILHIKNGNKSCWFLDSKKLSNLNWHPYCIYFINSFFLKHRKKLRILHIKNGNKTATDRTLIFSVRLYSTVLPHNVRNSSNSSYPKIRSLRFEPITLNDWVSSMVFFWKNNKCSCWTVQLYCMAELFGNCKCKILTIFFFYFSRQIMAFRWFFGFRKKV